jgi:CDP-diacylglycerol--glycerol-3-phosphate 3-phosphatidyltransferase
MFTPPARWLTKLGVRPDAVTIAGTAIVVAVALSFYPAGWLFAGSAIITVCVFSDTLDGVMARMQGRVSKWGAFLDSTLDRFADAAVFGGLMLYFLGPGDSSLWAGMAVLCLVLGQLTSYARARAEGLGLSAKTGIAERADRLVAILVGAGFAGLGVPWILQIVLVLLSAASAVTVVQRILMVRGQALATEPIGPAPTSLTPESHEPPPAAADHPA